MLNNSSVSQLTFEVVEGLSGGDLRVICTKNPATEYTSFIISRESGDRSQEKVVMEVFDFAGRQLYKQMRSEASTDGSFVVSWNLNLSGGARLQTGVYLCRFTVGDASKTVKLIVLKQ